MGKKNSISDCALSITAITFFFSILPPCRIKQKDWDHTSDTADLETGTDLCGKLSLSATQDNIQEFLVCRHRRNLPSGEKRISNLLSQIWHQRAVGKLTHILPRRLHDGHKSGVKEVMTLEVMP